MACEQRALVVHVHGHEADIDAFFELLETTLADVEKTASLIWPSLEILEPDLEEDE